jgi:hypothetical protein
MIEPIEQVKGHGKHHQKQHVADRILSRGTLFLIPDTCSARRTPEEYYKSPGARGSLAKRRSVKDRNLSSRKGPSDASAFLQAGLGHWCALHLEGARYTWSVRFTSLCLLPQNAKFES